MTSLDALQALLLDKVQTSPDGFIVLTEERIEELFQGLQGEKKP